MSLDNNLFTLNVRPRPDAPRIVELVDPRGTIHYLKERSDGADGLYKFDVYDPLSESLLASVSGTAAIAKHKTIELHNPSAAIELKYSGLLTFKWTFRWEEHEFEWKREECILIRKPDPPVLVAIAKEPPGKLKTKAVQILDYNLNRFDIHDRKGLEIVLLSALLSFQDYAEEKNNSDRDSPNASAAVSTTASPNPNDTLANPPAARRESPPPPLPPKPQKTGAELIEEMQKGELGEVLVSAEKGGVQDYARYCANLLEGDNMLYIVLRSSSPLSVPKVLEIVHQTKRIRHKEGIDDELHQYVQYDTVPTSKKGPRVIKLDDTASSPDKYKPPESLTVHLSKIPMPELQPKAKDKTSNLAKEHEIVAGKGKGKENDKGRAKESKSERKRREKEEQEQAKRDKEERVRREKEDQKDALKKGKQKSKTPPIDGRDSGSGVNKKPSERASSGAIASLNSTSSRTPPPKLDTHVTYNSSRPRPQQSSPMPSLAPPMYPMSGSFSGHQRTTSSPRLQGVGALNQTYPSPVYNQRPVSAYGAFLGVPPPPPPPQDIRRSGSPNTLVDSLMNKLKTKAW